MSRQIKIYKKALLDIENSVAYYQQEQKGVGKKFKKNVVSTFKKIQDSPFAVSFAYDKVRYKVVERFPHIVLYEFDDAFIYILRVFETHQDALF